MPSIFELKGRIFSTSAPAVDGGRVFAVSASRGDELRQFISAGCDGAFAKPFKRAQLVEFLARHLDVAPGLVELEGRPATETEQGPTEAESPLESTLADDEAMLPLITEFLRLLTTQMDLVTKACDRGDFAQLSSTVHQIKGSAGTFGYDVISEQAIRIERAIKENRNREEIGLRTRELLKLCERALAAPVPNQQS